MQWLSENRGLRFTSYDELWAWSVSEIETFWQSIWEYFDVIHQGKYKSVVSGTMPHCQWFEGVSLNYAEHIFRKASDDRPAIIWKSESSQIKEISWRTLKAGVATVQQFLLRCGIQTGNTVAAYLPCIPEASESMLAVTSLGAIWSSCSPDFGTNSVIDRFAQIEPKVLIAVDRYEYGGKVFDKTDTVREIAKALPTIEHILLISESAVSKLDDARVTLRRDLPQSKQDPTFVRVPFSHPLWILYSSGTTGLPKAITHSHGGILLEQLKYGAFHNDFKEGERCFWYTTTGWMMWNYIHGALLAGGVTVLYDGSPGHPDLEVLWKFCNDTAIAHFGTSAAFVLANMKAGIAPGKKYKFEALRSIGCTGSTLPPEGFNWIYHNIKNDLWLHSMSGGTDVCSAFVGGNPTIPVYSGEIQCRALGCKLECYDEEGNPILEQEGEMVITRPMPSMPIYFWNDPNSQRYMESYFEMYQGIWRHGDWIEITSRKGVIIYGRSDATLNRGGIRIGTSEIYRAVDKVSEIKDSLIVCIEKSGGEFWMPLFVVMNNREPLTDEIRKKINTTIRSDYSPRHVPDTIIEVTDLPYTISGKKTETPIKKVLMGKDPKKVVNTGSLRNPESMNFFIALYESMKNN